MGKKKVDGAYNDFLDGEKLRDNAEVRTSLQGTASMDHGAPPRRKTKGSEFSKGRKGPPKPQLTHFLCLPLVNENSRPQLETRLSKLRQELGDSDTVPVNAIRPAGTLHLTLGVMSLDDEQLESVKQYLQELDLESILYHITAQATAEQAAQAGTVSENLNAYAMPDVKALTVDLKGLVPMQAPHKTSILYAEPSDKTQRLQPFGDKLKREFTNEGFLIEDKRTLRLHATIINTIYAKKGRRGGAKAKKGDNKRVKESLATSYLDTVDRPDGVDGTGENIDDGTSTAGSTAGSTIDEYGEVTTAPPDPSTTETKVPKLDGADGHGPNAKSWMRFDARDLIERYKDVVWADNIRIDRVQICKMGAKKIMNEKDEVVAEEYEVVSEKVIGA